MSHQETPLAGGFALHTWLHPSTASWSHNHGWHAQVQDEAGKEVSYGRGETKEEAVALCMQELQRIAIRLVEKYTPFI